MRELKILIGTLAYLTVFPAFATETLTCMSENQGFQRCALSQADQRDIRIKSVKSGDCNQNNAWGVDSSGIWVSKGCGAIFEYSAIAGSSSSSNSSESTDSGEGTAVYVAPGFVGPYYGPGFYYGAGYYDSNGWDGNNHCQNGGCNRDQNQNYNQSHENEDENRGMSNEGFHGGGGGGRR